MRKTLDDLKSIERDYFVPAEVADVMGWDAHAIRVQAHQDPSRLGFPVIVYKTRTKIPKIPFLRFMGVL